MGYQITYDYDRPDKPFAWQAFMSAYGLIMGNAETFDAASCELYIAMNELLEEPCSQGEIDHIRADYGHYAQQLPYPGSPDWRPMHPYDGPGFGDDVHELENIARRIFSTAMKNNQAGETLEHLFAGDGVTVSAEGELVFISEQALMAMNPDIEE